MTIPLQRCGEGGSDPPGPRGGAGRRWLRRLVRVALAFAVLSGEAPLLAQPAPPGSPPPPPGDTPPTATAAAAATAPAQEGANGAPAGPPVLDEAAKAEAKKKADNLYQDGQKLYKKKDYAAALARYQAAFRTYPTRSARLGEGACLFELKRLDEALDVLEATLREYGPSMPAKIAEEVRRHIDAIRAVTGAVMVTGAEVDALIVIDGRLRGRHPVASPMPVLEGMHLVRIYKEGFALLERSVDIAKGNTETIAAKLTPLAGAPAGRLRVSETGGKKMQVVVDGVPVGETPWEGPVSAGEHTVVLRPLAPPPDRGGASTCGEPGPQVTQATVADESLATAPKRVVVKAGDTASLPLKAEALDASMRLSPEPATASVVIDGVAVGRGGFEGRFPAGEHVIELTAEGYLPEKRRVTLQAGEESLLSIPMSQDPASPLWARRTVLALELQAGVPLAPTFGGQVVGNCAQGCQLGLGTGGRVALRGTYEIADRVDLGLTLGYLGLEQSLDGRNTVFHIDDSRGKEDSRVSLKDTIALQGFQGGLLVAYRLGERFPVHLGVAAGVGLGSISDTRLGYAADAPYAVGPVIQSGFFPWLFLEPELRAGVRVTGHLSLGVSLSGLFVIVPGGPQWSARMRIQTLGAASGQERIGTFSAETVTGPVIFALTPGLNARYEL